MAEPFDHRHRPSGAPQSHAEFDRYARSYEELHSASVGASGESPEYFHEYKVACLRRLLGAAFDRPLLDFGCGIANLTRLFVRSFRDVHGYDPSTESIVLARERAKEATFFDDESALPRGHYGAIVLSGVLHHVPPFQRKKLLSTVLDLLAPGGRVVIFEHNPLNPLTRRAVADCPFDDNAVLLYPWEVNRLLRAAGLRDVEREYIVFFPHLLASLRPLEPRLAWLPIGAQVCAWGFKR